MNDSKPRPLVSVVVPCFNEAEVIPALRRQLASVLAALDGDYEIIAVDDGSRDGTRELLDAWRADDPAVRIIGLARNFGKEAALSCGLHFTHGRAVAILDADLQDPPELLHDMLAKWRTGSDIVLARRRHRRGDGWFKRVTAAGFYRLMSLLAGGRVPANVGDFRLMDRRVVEVIGHLPEKTRFMKGLMNYAGFRADHIEYERPARAGGRSHWSPWRLWNLAIEGVTSFSTVPLRAWGYIGVLVALAGMAYAAFIVARTLIYGVDVPGYASIVTLILFFSGVQLISIGILGEYLARVFIETKNRPLYVVERMDGFDREWVAARRDDILGNIVLTSACDETDRR